MAIDDENDASLSVLLFLRFCVRSVKAVESTLTTATRENLVPRIDSSSCGSFRNKRSLRSSDVAFRHDQVKLQLTVIVQAANDRVLLLVDADSE